jgi:mono/diheme cytochrome c family protein
MKDAAMAPFKSVLDHEQAEAIRAYVTQRANEDAQRKSAAR